MNEQKNESTNLITVRGELALLLIVIMNSFGVVLMLYSGSGISAISSVPYAFSEVFPQLTLGTWTSDFKPNDPAEKICTLVLVKLCSRIFLWNFY